jgi:hypothetical protein
MVALPLKFFNRSGDSARTGVLTDGLKWSLWHYRDGLWYQTDFYSKNEAGAIRVLSIAIIWLTNIRNPSAFGCWALAYYHQRPGCTIHFALVFGPQLPSVPGGLSQ